MTHPNIMIHFAHRAVGFAGVEQVQTWRTAHSQQLNTLEAEVAALPDVQYAEVWLNQSAASAVVGFNNEDTIIVERAIDLAADGSMSLLETAR